MITLNGLNCNIKFGIELEFYIENIKEEHLLFESIKNKISLLDFFCEKENSICQYEIKSTCYTNFNKLIKHFILAKKLISETAQKFGGNASFKAKPYLNRAGSALNIHVNLIDLNNRNLFYCNKQKYSKHLIYSIGGLCAMMRKYMSFFAPNKNSYLRFKYPDIHTPTTISWGVNNRTTAIRVLNSENKCRLEHRVPGADCNLEKVLKVIIKSIVFGIKNKVIPPNRIYGIASDLQYKMESLIKNS
ncbi:MAG: glutamine synthetase [Wolbachia endosymbiont of Menacanthus eurysternus]|nr:MAG: glutamine synthetase [Wolbachia endosymbiont of Menacanthus eurysternus]